MPVLERIPVILNPSARSERSGGWRDRIRALSPQIEIHETEGRGHARELARQMAAVGVPKVVAAGGDGTVNEVVNGLVEGGLGHGTALGVLPTGTMNVFAVELGLPPSMFLRKCWEVVEGGRRKKIDLWRANDAHFVQLAGVGLDAEVIRETSWAQKKLFGPLSYVMAAANMIGHERVGAVPASVVVHHPQGADVRGAIVLLGNGQRYGGPFRMFKNAVNNDGLLDVIVLKEPGYVQLMELLTAASLTGFENCVEVEYFQTNSLRVEGVDGKAVAVEVDGDLVGDTPVDFSLAEHALPVLVPGP